MAHDFPAQVYFTEKLVAAAPADFHRAVKAAAERNGLTTADYLRRAVAAQMRRDGVPFPRLPEFGGMSMPGRLR